MNDQTLNTHLRPLLSKLGVSAHMALRRVKGPKVWAWLEQIPEGLEHPSQSLVIGGHWWFAVDLPASGESRSMQPWENQSFVCLPLSGAAVLECAAEVARARGYDIRGWHWDTLVGERAWLVGQAADGSGAVQLCFQESPGPRTEWEIPLRVLGLAEKLGDDEGDGK